MGVWFFFSFDIYIVAYRPIMIIITDKFPAPYNSLFYIQADPLYLE